MKRLNRLVIISFALLMTFAIVMAMRDRSFDNALDENGVETTAEIVEISNGRGYTSVVYKYFVNGRVYESVDQIQPEELRRHKNLELIDLGIVKVRYLQQDPEVSKIVDERF